MDLLLLTFALMCALLYNYMTSDDASRMQSCQEPDFEREIDQYRTDVFMAHWSVVYGTNPVLHRVEFKQFILNPRGYLAAHIWRADELVEDAPHAMLPLLPKQACVADQLDLDQLQQERALATLERQYSQISNSNGQCMARMGSRNPKNWKTRGVNAHMNHA